MMDICLIGIGKILRTIATNPKYFSIDPTYNINRDFIISLSLIHYEFLRNL